MARKLVVTSASDNVSSATSGMLRYYVKNSQSGDTITFAVAKVTLAGQIDVSSSVVIDGGANKTTLDGNFKDRILNVTAYFSSDKITIKNLKLINGKRTSDYGWGGGMYVFTSSGNVAVDNCIFYNNEAVAGDDGQGGALRNQGGIFTNCVFSNNKVSGTAGPQGGGGVAAIGGTFINCVFTNNAAKWGGAVYASNNAKFYNCTITNNKATSTSSSGGIQSEGATFVNCVAYNNHVNSTINNVNAIDNSVVKNSAFEAGNALVGTEGNIGLPTSPFKGGHNTDSLSLAENSTCIDAGTTTGITVLTTDLAGNKRIANGLIDLGAYEYASSPITSLSDSEIAEKTPVLYPNPSTGTVYLNKGDLQNSHIEIYDLVGNFILAQDNIGTGDAISIPQSGVYIVKIKIDGKVYNQKLIVE